MNRLAVATSSAVALFMAASVALAAPKPPEVTGAPKPSNVIGKIATGDVANDVVTMPNGQYYMVPPAIKLDDLKAGDQVTMSVDTDQNGINRVISLTKAN